MRISIIGSGYVGLVTGACLAERGHQVICVDVDAGRVAMLNQGQSPIFEAGLDRLLEKNVGKSLKATVDLRTAVVETEVTFIAVGTPFNGREIDLSAVMAASRQIGEALKEKAAYHLVVVKSTVVPGTTDLKVIPVIEEAVGGEAGEKFGVGMNPEFLSEGEAVNDFMFPDRIVIGGIDDRSRDLLESVYSSFDLSIPRIRTNTRTAEMIKYSSNALLAALISLTNELANLGAALGQIDTIDVMRGVHLSQYFKGRTADGLPPITAFLAAGCGFGGSCLPKDVSALIAHGESAGVPMPLLRAVLDVNRRQPEKTIDLLRKHWPDLQGVRVAVLGLSFKPDTNDVRESPAFPIIRGLLAEGSFITAFDPVAMPEARKALNGEAIDYCDSLESAIEGAQAVLVVTPWQEFRRLPELLAGREPAVVLIDGRRFFAKNSVAKYEGIGW
jgi:UDPglucose 6-dehydrogenase/GDP-mannose 6-dehydrogenase